MKKSLKTLIAPAQLKLKTTVIVEVVLILTAMLGVMFYYSHQTLRNESMKEASQTLETTVLRVDNVLLSVEQSAGNFYWEMMDHLNNQDRMWDYCRHILESNPNVMGCVIALKPYYVPGQERFLAYAHRARFDSPELIESDFFSQTHYTKQPWYVETMKSGQVGWMDSRKGEDGSTFITFCLPIRDKNGDSVGVMAVDVSIALLSRVVLDAKPTPNSYGVMLDQKGAYLVHPEREVRIRKTALEHASANKSKSAYQAAEAMLAGESGSMFFNLNDEDWVVFFHPFKRSAVPGRAMSDLNWSIGIVYPENDIFGAYNHQFWHVLMNAAIGLLVFFLLCRIVIRRQMRPLRVLTEAADSIADGNYNVTVPDTERKDEIGLFQQNFQRMQSSLVAYLTQKQELTAKLEEQREKLRKTNDEANDANQVKVTFLRNITDQIIPPAEAIDISINNLCTNYQEISLEEADREVANIKRQRETILSLLNKMLGKGTRHE